MEKRKDAGMMKAFNPLILIFMDSPSTSLSPLSRASLSKTLETRDGEGTELDLIAMSLGFRGF
jgi:hypothetical protein